MCCFTVTTDNGERQKCGYRNYILKQSNFNLLGFLNINLGSLKNVYVVSLGALYKMPMRRIKPDFKTVTTNTR